MYVRWDAGWPSGASPTPRSGVAPLDGVTSIRAKPTPRSGVAPGPSGVAPGVVVLQQIGAEALGAGDGLVVFPCVDAGLVAAEEDVGDSPAVVFGGAGVDGGLEEVVLE